MNVAPVLVCKQCAAPRLHIFIETRPRRRRRGEIPYVDCIYACDACGASRPWGIQSREATIHGRRLSDAMFVHAQDEHGMRWSMCPHCRGVGAGCPECDGEGETWVFGSLEPCGPACLIEGLEPSVGE
jgi:hypothetical protein